MLRAEDYLSLKDLFEQGVSISEISRQTGYDRKTIRKYVGTTEPPLPKKRARKTSKLDGYREYITGRLNVGPLSARLIYSEILKTGFTGKYTIVREFVRETKRKMEQP
jgi:transposase